MVKSAGIIPFRERIYEDGRTELEFFVGRPWMSSDYYAFLKGGMEEDENVDETALREFKEESGLTLDDCESQMLIPLGWVQQNCRKMVFAFGLHYPNIDPKQCSSNLTQSGKPEIVDYAWMTYDELKQHTTRAHLQYYKKLIAMNNNSDSDEDVWMSCDDDFSDDEVEIEIVEINNGKRIVRTYDGKEKD